MPTLADLDPLAKSLPSDHHRMEISSGVKGTAETIERMLKLIQIGKRDMRLRPVIGEVIANCKQKDYRCYAKAIHDYVCYKIKYAYDPVDIELIEDPINIIKAGIADCDSKCILFCSMCEQIGLPCRLVTVKSSMLSDEFSHVFAEVNIKGQWVASDCTMPDKGFGWSPPSDMPRKTWGVSETAKSMDSGGPDILGLGRMGCADKAKCSCGCSDKEPMMSALGLGSHRRKGKKRRSGMKGLGDYSNIIDLIQAVMDGSYASELQSAKNNAYENQTYTYNIMIAAQNAGDSNLYNIAAAAYNAALDNLRAVQSEISTYSNMVNTIQTYSMGALRPPQLAAMGLEPATTAITLAGIAAVAAIAYTLSSAYQARQRTQQSLAVQVASLKEAGYTSEQAAAILENYTPPSDSGGGLTGSIGTTAIIVGLAALGFMFLKKRGTI